MLEPAGRSRGEAPGEAPGATGPAAGASGGDPPARRGPSRAVEDYLKAVYKLQQSSPTVSTSALAEELRRSAASVTNMVQGLAEQGLLEYAPYRGVRLTPAGELAALRIIRRHRVLELYLIEKLGYTWDNVHEEAERLEHAASDRIIDRMARALGEPSFDPHGAPIPTREGEIVEHELTPLDELPVDTPAVVRQVSDDSPEELRRAAALRLYPGTEVCVKAAGDEGVVAVAVEGQVHRLDPRLARAISVEIL